MKVGNKYKDWTLIRIFGNNPQGIKCGEFRKEDGATRRLCGKHLTTFIKKCGVEK